jgi:hypothetical protein
MKILTLFENINKNFSKKIFHIECEKNYKFGKKILSLET